MPGKTLSVVSDALKPILKKDSLKDLTASVLGLVVEIMKHLMLPVVRHVSAPRLY